MRPTIWALEGPPTYPWGMPGDHFFILGIELAVNVVNAKNKIVEKPENKNVGKPTKLFST